MQIPVNFSFKKSVEKIGGFVEQTTRRFQGMEQAQKEPFSRLALSLLLTAGVVLGSVAAVTASARYASVTVDGKGKPVVEIESTKTEDILRQTGVSAKAGDLVLRTDEKGGNIDLTVRTAKYVSVSANGETRSVLLHFGDTVSGALEKAGVTLGPNDIVTENTAAKVDDGMKISVDRRYNVNIVADGKTTCALVGEGTVSHALSQAGVMLGAEDITNKKADDTVADGMTIQVGRVTYKDVTTTQPIAFSTVTQKDSSMNSGTKTVKTHGKNGVKTTVTRQKLCDGKVVQTSVLKTETTEQPVNEVVAVGTKSLGRAYASVRSDGTLVDQNGSTVSYRRVFTGRCSAYSCGTTTSTGLPVAFGRVAVNPHIIPYGSRLYICSPDGRVVYGYAVAADTGGAAMSGRIVADLYYPSESRCEEFGSRTMNVYVLG